MKTPGDVYIAGSRTAKDWNVFRAKLSLLGADPALWHKAFDDYFYERLSLRYLEPIKVLQDNGTYQISVNICSAVRTYLKRIQR